MAFEVMRHVFAIHNEIGRFFDESIYKRELANRMPHVRLEEPIEISFDSFRKTLFIDVLVGDGGLFEFKAAKTLGPSHRMQLLNYLLLCDLEHGKLINVRSQDVEHEFVNATLCRTDRTQLTVHAPRWNERVPGTTQLLEHLFAILNDWGTGLAITLYEEAVMHLLGGAENCTGDVAVTIGGNRVGTQRMRLIAPGVALKITAIVDNLERFEGHARRLLAHLDLHAIAWANVNVKQLTFTTIER